MNTNKWIYIDNYKKLETAIDIFLSVKVLAIDTETTGLDPHINRLRLIQIAMEGNPTYILDCYKILPKGSDLLKKIFNTFSIKIFHNAKFDIQFLFSIGILVNGPIFDTFLAAKLLRTSDGPKSASLASVAKHYLDIELSKEEQTSNFDSELSKEQLDYAAYDTLILLELRRTMIEEIKKNGLIEAARLEFKCVYAIADIEYSGIYLDKEKWNVLLRDTEKRKETALSILYPYIGYPVMQLGLLGENRSYGFNVDSNKEILSMLNKNGIDVLNTSRQSLMKYKDDPLVSALLEYRHHAKALSTFLYSVPGQINIKTDKLHPKYSQMGAGSGRMSCGGPNIQQIPRDKEFRCCFTAPKGRKLVIADYSQIELRVVAQMSGDVRMIGAYQKGEDLHRLTASLIIGKEMNEITKYERQSAKAVNFGLVFGMGANGLMKYATNIYGVEMTYTEAEIFRNRFFLAYKGVEGWHTKIKNGMPLVSRTLAGRKHTYSDKSGLSGRYNMPVQGSAADILKNALGMLYDSVKNTNTNIIAVIHDEIILECDVEEAEKTAIILKENMEHAGVRYMKDVPVIADVKITDDWACK